MRKTKMIICVLCIILIVVIVTCITHIIKTERIKTENLEGEYSIQENTTVDVAGQEETESEKSTQSTTKDVTYMQETTKQETTKQETTKQETSEATYNPNEDFYISEIDDELFARIDGKSYKPDCTIPISELRYVHVLHIDEEGETHTGELICNKAIADDLIEIFRELYEAKYPIEKIRLVDEYDADDDASMADNNSSCFNYRTVPGKSTLSKHARGLAIDINTLYNPYIHTVDGRKVIQPYNATEYEDRSAEYPYKIEPDDICVRLFKEHGFTWGGDWSSEKDYQHFQK